MARDVFEKDVLDQLRDMRKQMAALNTTVIKIAEGMDQKVGSFADEDPRTNRPSSFVQ